MTLDPKRVKPFAKQPRKRFRGIPQLAESIRTVGQVTPIVVTGCDEDGYDAELVDGERRLAACLMGKIPIRAVLEKNCSEGDRYVKSVAANFCRQGHDAVEIMQAVLTLKKSGRTSEEIGRVFGKTAGWVAQYASLQRLAPEVLEKLKVAGDEAKLTRAQRRSRGRLTLSVAMLLVPLPHSLQVKALDGIVLGKMSMAEARTFVRRLAAGTGARVGKRVSPRGQFQAISSAVDNCYHTVDRYLRMPGSQIKGLVRAATPDERIRVAERLESLCDSLLMLADEIHKT